MADELGHARRLAGRLVLDEGRPARYYLLGLDYLQPIPGPRSGLGLDVAIMDRKLLGSSGVDVAYTAAEIGIFEAVLGMRDRPCGPLGSWGDRDG